jgi:Mrp family chromosome partitioning ATPase
MNKKDCRGVVVISGTSGSGKSTAIMRAALRLSANGDPVSWVDPEEEVTPRDVRAHSKLHKRPYIVAIDDADLYGAQLTPLIRELVMDDPPALVVVAIRSGRVDRVINPTILDAAVLSEISVPLLSDDDIDKLIDVLVRENRPGRLRGLTRDKQRALFREQSGMDCADGRRAFRKRPRRLRGKRNTGCTSAI